MLTSSLAAVVTKPHEELEIKPIPIPDLEPGAMLGRVEAATLCGTDVHAWERNLGRAPFNAYIPGHETAMVIEQMNGPRTDLLGNPLQVGERVLCAYPRCGKCYWCTVASQPSICPNGMSFGRVRCDQPPYLLGGCSEFHYLPPRSDIVKIPDEVPGALAAASACALRTVLHGFERLARTGPIEAHETVVVQGSGPVGLFAVTVARDRGARRVLVIGDPPNRLQVAEKFGADATLSLTACPDPSDRRQWVLDHTMGRGADIGVQCAVGAAIPEGLAFLRDGGRYLSIGGGGGMNLQSLNSHGFLITVRSGEGRHFYQALEFLGSRRERFPFEQMITGQYTLEGASEALRAMAEYREVKPVIYPNGKKP
ncbi:MAG: zinc-binding dehydrogenase [Dehalococcoidia bacterium]|nr:zinc-binding dehydrogenase [Dehalococcoidia bacterium]